MSDDHLFLPRGYSENQPEPVDDAAGNYWASPAELAARDVRRYQDPVYRFAARRLSSGDEVVLDVGCGTGDNMARRIASRVPRAIGVDQPSAVTIALARHPDVDWIAGDLRSDPLWQRLRDLRPDLVICADVIEHVDDPVTLLGRLRELVGTGGRLVLSTPDRERVENQPALGPPRNPHHIREWTHAEMTQLVEFVGFAIRSSRHVLPRRYPLTTLELKMVAWRAAHLRAVPGPRSCMVFELVAA
ncbi:MAG: class I SAM-dependent methyltransferase [Acidimicrobiia bacterium]